MRFKVIGKTGFTFSRDVLGKTFEGRECNEYCVLLKLPEDITGRKFFDDTHARNEWAFPRNTVEEVTS